MKVNSEISLDLTPYSWNTNTMSISPSKKQNTESSLNIGRVFTPVPWARWCLEHFKIYDSWRDGAKIIDPTCGNGSFFRALFLIAQIRNEPITLNDLLRLTGVEINPQDKSEFIRAAHNEYGLKFPESNFVTGDFIDFKSPNEFDIAVGNPPWANFTDLPIRYKERLKDCFIKYGLVKNKKDVLLGSSRVDLATLILKKVIEDHVCFDGAGYFFVPLSIFFNEDANKYFRPQKNGENSFSVVEIFDFEKGAVFDDVSTRNGFVYLKRGDAQRFPVPVQKMDREGQIGSAWCRPVFGSGAWIQSEKAEDEFFIPRIEVRNGQLPRQGMNTGGLNKVFLLERSEPISLSEKVSLFKNGFGEFIELETNFIFPLMHTGLFGGRDPKRFRYILCLHENDGAALASEKLADFPKTKKYVDQYKAEMCSRKGVLIQSHISKGRFWSLIGVGPYSFSQYKIAWESLGKSSFNAVVLEGYWQGNQAMHAYIPSSSRQDAERVCHRLNTSVPAYLEAFGMEGTCNWAQPGRIKRLLVEPG